MDEAKTNLIHAAEVEFAEKGISGASVRMITERAGMNVASINYHFGSKEELFKAMFLNRVDPINKLRIRLLKEADITHGSTGIPVYEIASIMVRPMISGITSDDPSVMIFLRAASRFMTECEALYEEIKKDVFADLFSELVNAMRKSLPELNLDTVVMRLHFAISIIIGSMNGLNVEVDQVKWSIFSFNKEEYIRGATDAVASILNGFPISKSHEIDKK